MKLYSAQTSQAIDLDAIDHYGIAGILLMKRAAWFSLQTLQNQWPNANRLSLICGTGNNGGDGFVLAQYAMINGYEVQVSILGDTKKIAGDALTTYQEMLACGITPVEFSESLLQNSDITVDAIFGTGLNQPIQGHYAQAIKTINQSKHPVLALDIPSGVNANNGAILGCAIQAQHTCTFITRKLGLYTAQGQSCSGKIHYSNLFLDKSIYPKHPALAHNHKLKYWLNRLPERQAIHHKGSAGTVCLIGGNHNMMGAIQLAGLAALKSGAGLTKVISQKVHSIAMAQAIPELMCYDPSQQIAIQESASAIAIGPGLGKDEWAEARFKMAIATPQPKVIDADALRLLAQWREQKPIDLTNANWVLTPHPGEAAELLGISNQDVQADRVQAIKTLQQKFGGVIVLKGNGTLIYDGETLEVCLAGNAGMAVGGMGDVLTGTIGALLAQGLTLWDAANLGVSLHAHAADIHAQQHGQASLLPTDVANTIGQLLAYQGSASHA